MLFISGRSQSGVGVVMTRVQERGERREESDEEERWWPGCDSGLWWQD